MITFKKNYEDFIKKEKNEEMKYKRSECGMICASENIFNIFKKIQDTKILDDKDKMIYQKGIGNYLINNYDAINNNSYIQSMRELEYLTDQNKCNLQECFNSLNLEYKLNYNFLVKIQNKKSKTLLSMNEICNTL